MEKPFNRLNLERAHWETMLFVDGRQAGSVHHWLCRIVTYWMDFQQTHAYIAGR